MSDQKEFSELRQNTASMFDGVSGTRAASVLSCVLADVICQLAPDREAANRCVDTIANGIRVQIEKEWVARAAADGPAPSREIQ